MKRLCLVVACVALVAACGSATSSASSTRTTPIPTVTPTPTSSAPDTETISTGATGIGVYQLITIPVVVITNNATRHSALGVIVHMTLDHDGRGLDGVDANAVDLAPGQSMAVAGDCTDTCAAANQVIVGVKVTSWGTATQVPVIPSSGVQTSGGAGRGQADVSATIAPPSLAPHSLVNGFAACYGPSGAIVGGGLTQFAWTGTSPTQSVSVPVIVSSAVSRCDFYSALGS